MNTLHWFAITLVVVMSSWLMFLTLVRRLAGRRWANIFEGMRGVLFWGSVWILFAAWSYFLQATTLSKLIRAEFILPDPWLGFIHEGVQLTTPYLMAFLLMLFAAAGAFLVATHLDIFLVFIGLLIQRNALNPHERAGFVQNLVFCSIFIGVGLLMVYADARIFALRWAMDISELEIELQGFSSIARALCWAYFLGLIALSWIVHRKYRQFLVAAQIVEETEPAERQEQHNQPTSTSQREPSQEPSSVQSRHYVVSEAERLQPLAAPSSQQFERQFHNRSDGDDRERLPATEFEPFSFETRNYDQNGFEEEVLPEHLDPFGRRRR